MRIHRLITVCLAIGAVLFAPAINQDVIAQSEARTVPKGTKKLLIHFGQDMPAQNHLFKDVREMESSSPFSGVVFRLSMKDPEGKASNFHKLVWGKRKIDRAEIEPQLKQLKQVKFVQFTDNFLRVNIEPGDVDWFDDMTPVIENFRTAAYVAANTPNCKGLLIDTECYKLNGRLFTYNARPLAGTGAGKKSLDEYKKQTKLQSAKIMAAIREEFPKITIFVTHGYEGVATLRKEGPKSKGGFLLPPFLDGLLSAAGEGVVFVDGYEKTYPFKTEIQFREARKQLDQGNLQLTTEGAAYKRHLSAACALSVDYPHKRGTWNPEPPFAGNHFSPAEFQAALTHAMNFSERYVWLYNQKEATWFPLNTPKEYVDAIWAARLAVK